MPNMKIAICGVWHVHAADYLKSARAHAEVIGAWDADPARCAVFCAKHDLTRMMEMAYC